MDKTTKSLIQGYIHKAEKKLKVAEKLLKSGDYEDSVSRAYYSAYHSVQALLLTEGQHPRSHKGAITLFGLLFIKTGKFKKEFGKYLINLKEEREGGDYEAFSYVDKETAKEAILMAKKFIREVTKYLKKMD